jgi:hypothetical protein
VVKVVQGGGVELSAKGVMAIADIEQGAIITCFGGAASVREDPAGDELRAIMNTLESGEGESCQYTSSHNLQGEMSARHAGGVGDRTGDMRRWGCG